MRRTLATISLPPLLLQVILLSMVTMMIAPSMIAAMLASSSSDDTSLNGDNDHCPFNDCHDACLLFFRTSLNGDHCGVGIRWAWSTLYNHQSMEFWKFSTFHFTYCAPGPTNCCNNLSFKILRWFLSRC